MQGNTEPAPITVLLTGLAAHAVYHFRVRATNGAGSTASADFQLTTGNVAPTAVDDRVTLAFRAVTLRPLANDHDRNQDAVKIISTTSGQHGTVSFDAETVTYTPDALGLRTDIFTYTISDGMGGFATATCGSDLPRGRFRGSYAQALLGAEGVGGKIDLALNARAPFTGR